MNEHKHGMTGAWALNALDSEEREQMLRYLEEDPEAAAEALSFEETAGELASSLPPLAPRPELKAAVMARIATTRQLSPLPETDEPADGTDVADAGPAPAAPAEVVPLERYRASVRRSRWAAVAATLLLVTTIVGVGLWNGERAAQQEVRASLEAMASQQASNEEERAVISMIMGSEDLSHLTVPSRDGGSLQLMYSREQQAMIVQAAGLPALAEDETYQLWMIDDDDIGSAGLLEGPDAARTHQGPIPEDVTLGLTIEPAGGSLQPSMDPLAAGVLS